MRSLTYRERLFVDYYLGESSESAVDAVRRAWYPSPEELGPRLLKKSAVQAAIAAGAGTAAITPNEVLARYADIAASDMRDFMAVDKNGGFKVDLKLIQQRNLGHLIKRAANPQGRKPGHRAGTQAARPGQARRIFQSRER